MGLLGFYREQGAIKAIESESLTFFDESLNSDYEARVVPVMPYQNNKDWQVNEYADCLDATVKSLLDQRIVWITSEAENSDFYVLMVVPPDVPEMSRTGVLLIKQAGVLKPMTVRIDNEDYLIEIKGCGSPVGLFPTTHYRNQAGCYNKSHLKVTGALTKEEGEREFEALCAKDSFFKQRGLSSQIKALAVTEFHYLGVDFSVLIRLVPSTIRASFSKHPILDELLKDRYKHSYRCMGDRVGALLQMPQPLHHQNLSINNMVYVDAQTFDLSDWSEVEPLFSSHCAMDYIKSVFPVFYLNHNMPVSHMQYFCDALHARLLGQPLTQTVDDLMSFLELHQRYLGHRGYDYYQHCLTQGHDFQGMRDNRAFFASYFGKRFQDSISADWAKAALLPSLTQRLEVLNCFIQWQSELSPEHFSAVISFDMTHNAAVPYIEKVQALYAPIGQFFYDKKRVSDLSQEDIGQFSGSVGFELDFLKELSPATLPVYHKRLSTLIQAVTEFLSTGLITMPSRRDFLSFQVTPLPHHLAFVLYPFLFVIYAFLETEAQFLKGALQDPRCTEQEAQRIRAILDQHASIEQRLLTEPDTLKQLFFHDIEAFLALFAWP